MSCRRCKGSLEGKRKGTIYCSRECSREAWEARNLRAEAREFWAGCRAVVRSRPAIRS